MPTTPPEPTANLPCAHDTPNRPKPNIPIRSRRNPPPTPSHPFGKFTLTIDCLGLLTQSPLSTPSNPNLQTSKPPATAISFFRLDTLLSVPIVDQIKIRCFHTCGPVEFEEGACLKTLWGMGDWLVERFREKGRRARVERRGGDKDGEGVGIQREWEEADFELVVFVG